MEGYRPGFALLDRYHAALKHGRLYEWSIDECWKYPRRDLIWLLGALGAIVDAHARPQRRAVEGDL